MKRYSYVNVYINEFMGARCEAHRQIIDEKASEGYRYVGFVPTEISDYGKIKSLDLIFETEIPEEGEDLR